VISLLSLTLERNRLVFESVSRHVVGDDYTELFDKLDTTFLSQLKHRIILYITRRKTPYFAPSEGGIMNTMSAEEAGS
jgi:hypothetical protein